MRFIRGVIRESEEVICSVVADRAEDRGPVRKALKGSQELLWVLEKIACKMESSFRQQDEGFRTKEKQDLSWG